MTKNRLKLGLGVLTVLATPIAVNTVASSDALAAQGWVKTGTSWYFYNQNGTLARNAWSGNYWLGADGKMVTNAWVDNGRYYVGADGAWVKGAEKPAAPKPVVAQKQGWVQSGGAWYFYNQGQIVRNAWVGSYWLGADGKMATSAWVDNGRYYVGENGVWVKDAKKPEAPKPVEKKQGWVKEGNTWYYFENGALARNKWISSTYWVGADGKMATSAWVDNGRYYVGVNGAWVKDAKKPEAEKPVEKKQGWAKEGTAWYYYNQGQIVKNSWVGSYWLGSDGKMATSAWVDNGRYYVDSSGKWVPNYAKADKNTPALNMPQYYQGDWRWAHKRYGLGTMAQSGCVPTSLAMVFNGLGQKVLPTAVADTIYNNTNEMNVSGLGTSGKGAVYAINAYGYKHTVITTREQLIAALQSGKPVFATVGNGIFAKGRLTHAIILSGYSNGKTKAMDPDSSYNTGKWYDINTIWNQRSTDPYDTNIGGSFVAIG